MENGKKVSKIVRVLSKITCIFGVIGIGLMIIAGMLIPYAVNNTNLIEQLEIKENKGLIEINVDNERNEGIGYILDNYTKTEQIIIGELYVVIGIISFVFLYLVFNAVHKLFYNIENGDTPFTEDNIKLVKDITNRTILFIIVPGILGIILEMIIGFSIGSFFNLSSIIIVLVLFSIGYVFEYGYKLQLEADEIL